MVALIAFFGSVVPVHGMIQPVSVKTYSVDICIYGGTAAGVIAAYTASKCGMTVIVVEPGKLIGGMTTGGLGRTDSGNKDAITGLSRRFYQSIAQKYGASGEQWAFEPHVALEVMQDELNTWGLAKDEFTDNGNWPHQLYVREARRMIGSFVMTENEILGRRAVPEPVGMGSYGLDSHNAQRYVTPEKYVQNEGDIGVHMPKPYSISYKAIIPKEKECRNLLVPVCASCSHIAYGSIRMEPVFMILGESAATAAALAIDDDVQVQKVNYPDLKKQLLKQGQHLTLEG